jgi:DNA-binding NarL/FixJ family response regulator
MLGELMAHWIAEKVPEAQVEFARSADAARQLFKARAFDVVLIGAHLPGCTGLSLAREFKKRHSETRCLLLSNDSDGRWVDRALKANVEGVITRFCDAMTLTESVRQLLAGRRYFSRDVTSSFAGYGIASQDEEPHRLLTTREYEVFVQIGQGKTVKGISQDLKLSPQTVSVHKYNIRKKTGLVSDAGIAHYCMEYGLLQGAA